MQDATDRLIERLVANSGPVRRLRPPAMRATLWLLVVVALGAMTILLFSDLALFARRARDSKLDLELVATFLTGISAVVAAFHLSLPGRPLATLGACRCRGSHCGLPAAATAATGIGSVSVRTDG